VRGDFGVGATAVVGLPGIFRELLKSGKGNLFLEKDSGLCGGRSCPELGGPLPNKSMKWRNGQKDRLKQLGKSRKKLNGFGDEEKNSMGWPI